MLLLLKDAGLVIRKKKDVGLGALVLPRQVFSDLTKKYVRECFFVNIFFANMLGSVLIHLLKMLLHVGRQIFLLRKTPIEFVT
jgi:fluoride ion exporter CrcB/FEX